MRRALIVCGILVLPVLLAACTLPGPDDPFADSLDPGFSGIPGLTPEHERSHPAAIHVTPDGKRAYVALAGTIARPDDRVAVVDLDEGKLIQHITVGRRPLAFAADPQEPTRLLVAHPYSASISVIDTERRILATTLSAPYYLEDLAFTPDGDRLLATDRDQDRLLVFNVSRDGEAFGIQRAYGLPTGPNPEHVVVVPPPTGDAWGNMTLVAASDRHGASVTIADLLSGATRRIDTGGAPLALAARDGFLFVAGYGPGNGTGTAVDDGNRSVDAGTAAIENSLLVLDLRAGPGLFGDDRTPVSAQRYISDTAHPDKTHARLKILGGAAPRALLFTDHGTPDGATVPPEHLAGSRLWIAYHGTDQVQALAYASPGDGDFDAEVLGTMSGAIGDRLSHVAPDRPLGPGRLSDTVHGLFETLPGPTALARLGDLLLVVAEFPELLHVVDLADCPGAEAATTPCTSTTIPLVSTPRPYPSGTYEEGERLFYSALPSADQDRSCASCHIGGLSTGTTWALPHRNGTPVRIPRLDQMADNEPWLYDGTVRVPEDYLDAAGGDLLIADPSDLHNLATRTSEEPAPGADPRFPGLRGRLAGLGTNATTADDYMRATFAYAIGEERLLPVPPRIRDAANEQGATLFGTTRAECMSCHREGDQAYLLTGDTAADIPKPPGADQIKAPPLRGLWDRHGIGFLHDGRADTLHQALLPRGSTCLADPASGLQASWHGDLDERTCRSVDELVGYLMAFEARR